VPHAFLDDWSSPLRAGQAQQDAGKFLFAGTQPGSLVVLP
jgi:hypothetical protein